MRLERRTKPQNKNSIWNWTKSAAQGIFQVGAHTVTIAGIASTIEAIALGMTELNTLIGEFEGNVDTAFVEQNEYIAEELDDTEKDLKNHADKMQGTLKRFTERTGEKIIEEMQVSTSEINNFVPDKVAARIIGIPYDRFESMSNFYPTLYFNFVEKIDDQIYRMTRAKARLPIKNEDFNNEVLNTLKERINERTPFAYRHGPNRYYYVSKDKRWKTTIYCDTQRGGREVVEYLCIIVGEDFDSNQGSYTVKGVRTPASKQDPSKTHIPPNPVDYHESFDVVLFRVTLILKGAISPITIWPVPG